MEYLFMFAIAFLLPVLLVVIPILRNKPRQLTGLTKGLIIATFLFGSYILVVYYVLGLLHYRTYLIPFVALVGTTVIAYILKVTR